MKFKHYSNLGAAIPRYSKLGLLIFNHAFFIGESDTAGIEIVICSWQHTVDGFKFVCFDFINHKGEIK